MKFCETERTLTSKPGRKTGQRCVESFQASAFFIYMTEAWLNVQIFLNNLLASLSFVIQIEACGMELFVIALGKYTNPNYGHDENLQDDNTI